MKKFLLLLALLFTIGMASSLVSAAPPDGDFEITRSTIDNGGGTSSGGTFSLTGTIGQHDASQRTSVGGGFLLAGGFWAKARNKIFSSGFED